MIADAVLAHRRDYWSWVERHAEEPRRGTLLGLREHWHAMNTQFFGGRLAEPYITLTAPSRPSLLGQCCPVSSWGSRLEIKIRPSLLLGTHPRVNGPLEGRRRFVDDVLLHELIHQEGMEVTAAPEPAYHGHGPVFTARANTIGQHLGLPPVIARNRGGSDQPRAATWPHCVRPVDHYLGAYQPAAPDSRDDTAACPHCDGSGRVPADQDAG